MSSGYSRRIPQCEVRRKDESVLDDSKEQQRQQRQRQSKLNQALTCPGMCLTNLPLTAQRHHANRLGSRASGLAIPCKSTDSRPGRLLRIHIKAAESLFDATANLFKQQPRNDSV